MCSDQSEAMQPSHSKKAPTAAICLGMMGMMGMVQKQVLYGLVGHVYAYYVCIYIYMYVQSLYNYIYIYLYIPIANIDMAVYNHTHVV